jgi:glyoxylase-like metal-dependent hydrolase (beta-lactamase superfamily II)
MAIIATNSADQQKTIFTGDTLMHRVTGRTDFQGGSAATLFDSVSNLYSYSDDTIVRSGHDYNGLLSTTIGECKKFNSSINSDTVKEDFIKSEEIANKSKKPPVRMDVAVPGCLKCGDI